MQGGKENRLKEMLNAIAHTFFIVWVTFKILQKATESRVGWRGVSVLSVTQLAPSSKFPLRSPSSPIFHRFMLYASKYRRIATGKWQSA